MMFVYVHLIHRDQFDDMSFTVITFLLFVGLHTLGILLWSSDLWLLYDSYLVYTAGVNTDLRTTDLQLQLALKLLRIRRSFYITDKLSGTNFSLILIQVTDSETLTFLGSLFISAFFSLLILRLTVLTCLLLILLFSSISLVCVFIHLFPQKSVLLYAVSLVSCLLLYPTSLFFSVWPRSWRFTLVQSFTSLLLLYLSGPNTLQVLGIQPISADRPIAC